jgi:hypothetical protein
MVKYRAVALKKTKIAALYFTMSNRAHRKKLKKKSNLKNIRGF